MRRSIYGALNQRIPSGGGAPSPIFHAPLQTTVALTTGTGSATFTRATTATQEDHEQKLNTALSGEVRFQGARRVRNLLANSVNLALFTKGLGTITAGISDPDGGTTAATFTAGEANEVFYRADAASQVRLVRNSVWLKRRIGSGDVSVHDGAQTGAYTVMALTGSWQRFAVPVGIDRHSSQAVFAIKIATSSDAIDIWHPQTEVVEGQSNQNPSEYVSVGVLSAPYHGAGVDGVKYFATENGNTVASNVVTEATGAAIAAATLKGYLSEGQRTNRCLRSQEFDNASWVTGNATISANATAAPDGTTTADKLVEAATSAEHEVHQGTTPTAAPSTLTVYLKAGERPWAVLRLDMGDNKPIYVDLTNGVLGTVDAAYTAASITPAANGWYRVSATRTTSVATWYVVISPTTGNGVAPTYLGDVTKGIYLWGAQLEAAAFASSYIPTTSAAVTRNADVLTYPASGNIVVTTGTAYAEIVATGGVGGNWPANGSGGTDHYILADSGNNVTILQGHVSSLKAYDGTAYRTLMAGFVPSLSVSKVACAWGGAEIKGALNGVVGSAQVFDGSFAITSIEIGSAGGSFSLFGTLKTVKIFDSALSDAAIGAL